MLNVLIVEDNPTDIAFIKSIFATYEDLDVNATCVNTVFEAVNLLSHDGDFDAILVDLSLPDSNGPETIKKIKEVNRGIPIICWSGTDDNATIEQCVRNGAYVFMSKRETNGNVKRLMISAAARKRAKIQASIDILSTFKDAFCSK